MRRRVEMKFKKAMQNLKESLISQLVQASLLTNHALKRRDFDIVTFYTVSDEDQTKS